MLTDLHIVITGAAGTLGQAAALQARSWGARVTGIDIAEATELGNTDAYYTVDLLDPKAAQSRLASVGKIDALLNIAGGFAMGDAAYDLDSKQWGRMFDLNVQTMRNACAGAVPQMLEAKRGAIVNVGAMGALAGQAGMSAYCCAKASVMRLTESLSDELRHEGINVNAVLPSIIDTPPNREAMPDADFSHWVSPEKLAAVMCFLASDAASAVHGALVPVRGLS